MLADQADHLIGVDTHKLTHTAVAVMTATGALGAPLTASAERAGYEQLLAYADQLAPAPRAWAIESSGSYGAGLSSFLLERAERVYEVDRPKRPGGDREPSPTRSTRSEPPGSCSDGPISQSLATAGDGRRSGSCCGPARAPSVLEPGPSTSSSH